jgi:hypothetical protein
MSLNDSYGNHYKQNMQIMIAIDYIIILNYFNIFATNT